jgi:hypothetical protein
MKRINVVDEVAYEDFANAIIIQAAEDYREAYKSFKKGDNLAMRTIKETEKFFNSEWCNFLCAGRATDIFKRLQDEQKKSS